jgi:GTP cyclohydrolase IA
MGEFQPKSPLTEIASTLRIDDTLTATIHSNEEKIELIRYHFKEIMLALGLDLTDDSLEGTPLRVARMYVNEIFSGLNPETFPPISVFKNTYGYHEMLVEKDIQLYSYCEHHFVPFIGRAHIAYFPTDQVIGLSKLNRIVQHFAKRPQVQERLTVEIGTCLKEILNTDDVAVVIQAQHLCVAARGVEDTRSMAVSSYFAGKFELTEYRDSFHRAIQ